MSMPRKETVKCPNCGATIDFTMWRSINTEMDFAIPDIISGKLFEVKCESCGESFHVDYPILFNDMIHDVMIWYQPDYDSEFETTITQSPFHCRTRVVTSMPHLKEKTFIFSKGYDDRVIEIVKAVVVIQVLGPDWVNKINGIHDVFYVEDDESPFVEIHYEDSIQSYRFAEPDYQSWAAQAADFLNEENNQNHIVDWMWWLNKVIGE